MAITPCSKLFAALQLTVHAGSRPYVSQPRPWRTSFPFHNERFGWP
jgi:hypothetical protein